MSPCQRMALAEGFINESARRKRLGQYFTGTQLGRVLAALSYGDKAVSIIDPMSGSGDLLAACAELGAAPLSMGALDIDPIALESCRERLPEASCVLGSAFSPTSLKNFRNCNGILSLQTHRMFVIKLIPRALAKSFHYLEQVK